MKKNVLFILFAVIVVFFVSCGGNGGEAQAPRLAAEVEPGPEAVVSVLSVGYALRINTSLMVLDGEDTGDETTRVRWGEAMNLGERILVGETRRLTNAGDNIVYYFTAVRRDNGSEGWAWTAQVTAGGNLAVVVVENANLYRGPRAIEVSGTILSRRTVVAYDPASESDGFIQVRGFDVGRGANIAAAVNHVRRTSLSTRHADVQSAILLQTALAVPAGQAVRRDALLDAALTHYPDSVFFPEVFEVVHPGVALPAPAADVIPVADAPDIVETPALPVSQDDYYDDYDEFFDIVAWDDGDD